MDVRAFDDNYYLILVICSAAFSLDRLWGLEEIKLFIAALSSAQKEHVVNICEPGWTDMGEMGLLSFYGKNLPKKTPLIEPPAPFLEMSFTLWCKKWCQQSSEVGREVVVVVAERC